MASWSRSSKRIPKDRQRESLRSRPEHPSASGDFGVYDTWQEKPMSRRSMALVLLLACCLTTASLTSPTRDRRPVLTNRLPLAFEANEGQVDPRVKFLARGSGYTVFLAATEMVLSLRGKSADSTTEPKVVRLRLDGANPSPKAVGLEELPGKVNYFIGNDPKKWRTDISTYARVRYESAYPG